MDHALGCLLGVAVGDAAGATLEREGAEAPVDEAAARTAMTMPGSASPLLGRGQITDDTELTISLARGAHSEVLIAGRLATQRAAPQLAVPPCVCGT